MAADSNAMCSRYLSLMYSYNLLPTIIRPTRVTNNTCTLIDIFVNSCSKFVEAGIVMTNISDHYGVFNVFRRSGVRVSEAFVEVSKRVVNVENMEKFRLAIADCNFERIMNSRCVETAYNLFSSKVKLLYDTNCPIKRVRVKKLNAEKPDITPEIKNMLKRKHKLQKLYNKKPLTFGNECRKLRNELTSRIRTAKAQYYKSQLSNDTRDAKTSYMASS